MPRQTQRPSLRRRLNDQLSRHESAVAGGDVMLDPLLNPWDAAALVPILREAGGQFFDWTGTDTIHGGNGISTNGRLKKAVQAIL